MNELNNETYAMNMRCHNCGHTFIRLFNKGVSCQGYKECPNCGCREAVTTSAD